MHAALWNVAPLTNGTIVARRPMDGVATCVPNGRPMTSIGATWHQRWEKSSWMWRTWSHPLDLRQALRRSSGIFATRVSMKALRPKQPAWMLVLPRAVKRWNASTLSSKQITPVRGLIPDLMAQEVVLVGALCPPIIGTSTWRRKLLQVLLVAAPPRVSFIRVQHGNFWKEIRAKPRKT